MRAAKHPTAALRRDAGHVDDAAVAPCAHVRHHRLRHVQRAAHVDVHHLGVLLGCHLHQALRAGDACDVDEHVNTPPTLQSARQRSVAINFRGDVACCAEVARARQGGGCVFSGFGVQVEDLDARAVLGKKLRAGQAQAARAGSASDDDGAVFEQHAGASLLIK